MNQINYQFNQQEAFDLLNSHVVKASNKNKQDIGIEEIGYIAGVVTLNDEIELIAKFGDELIQVNKTQFLTQLSLFDMSI